MKNCNSKDEYSVLFFFFSGSFLPSWIRIRICNLYADPDPDPAAQINADPCGSGYGSGSKTLLLLLELLLLLALLILLASSRLTMASLFMMVSRHMMTSRLMMLFLLLCVPAVVWRSFTSSLSPLPTILTILNDWKGWFIISMHSIVLFAYF